MQNENVRPPVQKQEKNAIKRYKAFPFSYGLSLDLHGVFNLLFNVVLP